MDQEQAETLAALMRQNNKQLERIADSLSRLVQMEQWQYQYRKGHILRIHKHTHCMEEYVGDIGQWQRIHNGSFPEHQFPNARPDI